MKQDAKEIAAVQMAARDGELQIHELEELQLALIGGGVGEVVFT